MPNLIATIRLQDLTMMVIYSFYGLIFNVNHLIPKYFNQITLDTSKPESSKQRFSVKKKGFEFDDEDNFDF